jgi:hypothetical protein
MRIQAIAFSAVLLSFFAWAQTPQSKFEALTPEARKAQCAEIEQRNAVRLQEGLHAVHPFEELCYPDPKTFDFANKLSARDVQEIITVLRVIVQPNNQQMSVDPETSTVTFRGTPGKLEMVDWLVRELDRPAYTSTQRANISVQELPVPHTEQDQPGKNDEVIRVFFLTHTDSDRGIQEILTVLRTVADVQKVFNYAEQRALVVRAPAVQMELVDYLIMGLDIAPGSSKSSPEFVYKAPDPPFARPSQSANASAPAEAVRVFYPAHDTTPQGVSQIVIALRSVVGIQKIFMDTSAVAIAVRGTAADMAATEWLLQALDIAADSNSGRTDTEFHVPGAAVDVGVIRVFYVGKDTTPAGLQEVMTKLNSEPSLKVASNATPPALIVRGSAAQIAQFGPSIESGLVAAH